jgi:CelD/BcsL family acetyltransferase involved in cellulose biosynthesis
MSVRITIGRSADEARAFADAWRGLGPADVNADPDIFLTVTAEAGASPFVLLAERDSAPCAILVARLVNTTLPVRLGYRLVYSPRVRSLTVVQGGLVTADDDEAVRSLFHEARAVLARGEADVLRMRRLRVGSHLHRLSHDHASWPTRGHEEPPSLRWRLRLPESLDEVLKHQSGRTRSNHRRYARKLEDELGDRLSFHVYRGSGDLERVMRDAEKVSRLTYQHRLGAGLAHAFERRVLEIGAGRGWLRAYVLSVDDEPRAFWIGLAYRGVFFTGPTGYDPSLAHLRLGTYVLMKMLEDLCADSAVEQVDYGIGDAEYKRHFGSESWLEEDRLVFAPSLRGVRVNMTRTAALGAAEAARRVAGGERIATIKKHWRAHLSSPARDGVES